MSSSKLIYLIIFSFLFVIFTSCRKKYVCACTGHTVYYTTPSPVIRNEEYYSTEQLIDEKLSKKKAEASCKLIESAFLENLPKNPYSSVESVEGSCHLK